MEKEIPPPYTYLSDELITDVRRLVAERRRVFFDTYKADLENPKGFQTVDITENIMKTIDWHIPAEIVAIVERTHTRDQFLDSISSGINDSLLSEKHGRNSMQVALIEFYEHNYYYYPSVLYESEFKLVVPENILHFLRAIVQRCILLSRNEGQIRVTQSRTAYTVDYDFSFILPQL